jgi:hypothetical protein
MTSPSAAHSFTGKRNAQAGRRAKFQSIATAREHAKRIARYHERRGTDPKALALEKGWSEDQLEALERAGVR